MKKATFIIILPLFMFLAAWSPASACVGRTLTIGSLGSAEEKLLSQLLAVIINERTGTTVVVEQYGSQKALYDAASAGKVSIFVENTGRALQMLGKTMAGDEEAIYLAVKEDLAERFGLVVLKSFGKSNIENGHFIPVVPASILLDYPALPRVVNRLAGIAEDRDYQKSVSSVSSGGKANRIARDFLLKKRFI